MNQKSGIVVLFSYRRPELTKAAIARTLSWPKLEKLYVTVDGLRSDANEAEKSWHSETVEIAKTFSAQNFKVEALIWTENRGLTAHALRAYTEVFKYHRHAITLEEDMKVSDLGLDFLLSHVGNNDRPIAATSYSRFRHIGKSSEFRVTWFPEQWGIGFNQKFFLEFIKVWESKVVTRDVLEKALIPLFGKNKKVTKTIDFWEREFRSAVNHDNWTDAVYGYTALKIGIPYIAPWNSFTEDLGFLDARGLSLRTKADTYTRLHREKLSQINGNMICLKCDGSLYQILSSDLKRRLIRKIIWESYKLNKFFFMNRRKWWKN